MSKEFKGTKDWKIVKLKATEFQTERTEIQFGNDGECVAEFVHNDYDAKLIEAAPILLKEHLMDLKHLKTWRSELVNAGLMGSILWNEYTDMIDSKEKAINKALN